MIATWLTVLGGSAAGGTALGLGLGLLYTSDLTPTQTASVVIAFGLCCLAVGAIIKKLQKK